MNTWEGRFERFDLTALRCYRSLQHAPRLERSLGTLGGGNHFIEIDKATDGTYYLIIHSGSRNLGKQVAEIYQQLAIDLNKGIGDYLAAREEIIKTYKEQGRKTEMAYKSIDDIIDVIRDSVDIVDIMKLVYNFKASEDDAPWKKKEQTSETDSTSGSVE